MSGTMLAGDRITREDGKPAAPDDIIDEAVVSHCLAHVEMMNDRAAFMLLGDFAFWIFVEKGKLRIRYSEHRSPRSFFPAAAAGSDALARQGQKGC